MVFFGQLREPELDSWSAPLLALRDEGQEQQVQDKMMTPTVLDTNLAIYWVNTTNVVSG